MKSTTANSSLRVIGGQWRSRKLIFPVVPGLRPTADRIRETLFNWLQNDIDHENCLDLFAGSGACGIEALSRGAKRVLFIENHAEAATAIQDNLRTLESEGGQVIKRDVLDWLREQPEEFRNVFGIAFIDPPYSANLEIDAATELEESGVLKPRAKIYIESDKKLDLESFPKTWENLRHKKAGIVNYYLFLRKAESQ